MPKGFQRALLCAAVIGLMGIIFACSAQPGVESDALTKAAVMPFAELLASAQQGDEGLVDTLYFILGTIARKFAHIAEYALLGLLLHLLLRSFGRNERWLPFTIGLIYAATDEVHQAFVPGRLGTPVDVIIDGVGVAIGVFAIGWLLNIRRKKHVHDS